MDRTRGLIAVTIVACSILTLSVLDVHAQEIKESKEERIFLEEMVITGTRTEKRSFDIPSTVEIITADDLQNKKQFRTIPEALKETPAVMVQKTSHGQGSPFIRGFTGFRTLFLIDGVRLNNSVFREGPNQYWNTVDPLTISRIEIIKGPGSVLYGSDAIGGTVNAITHSRDNYGEGLLWDTRLFYRYAGAENSNIEHAEISGSIDRKIGILMGISIKDFGDIRGGRDIGVQPKTGYNDLSGDIKVEYFLNPDSRLILVHQRVNQDDAWRTHKTIFGKSWEDTTVGNEKKRVLAQDRQLTYLQYHRENHGHIIDRFKLSLSYQVQEEEQFRIKSSDKSEIQGFDVSTFGAWIQLETPLLIGRLTYGVEYYLDNVDSFKRKYNADGSLNSIEIQGPVADDAAYHFISGFIQDDMPLLERTDLIIGARYTYAKADAEKVKDPVTGNSMSLSDKWDNLVGSIRLLYQIDNDDHWRLFSGLSQGFRAPNLSDLTRLDTARTNEIETAAPGLAPERFISYEAGIKGLYKDLSLQIAFFKTDISKMIVRTPTGNIIDGDFEITKKNSGDGFVQGVELGTSFRFHPQFTLFGAFGWMDGEVDTFPTSSTEKKREPLDRLMPTTGNIGVRWEDPSKRYWLEALSIIAKKQDNLSTRDKADTQRIPPGGTPGYTVYTTRGGWKVNKKLTLSASIENITNEDYRIHGSGQNEPGTNLIFSLDWKL